MTTSNTPVMRDIQLYFESMTSNLSYYMHKVYVPIKPHL